jgi:hypothetical protein
MTKAMLQCIRPANSWKDGAASPHRAASEKARFRRMLEKLSPSKSWGNPQLNVRSVNFSAHPIFSRETWRFGDRRRAEYGKDRAVLGPSERARTRKRFATHACANHARHKEEPEAC